MLNIIEYDLPKAKDSTQEYIVLESISSNSSKVIHVINMAEAQGQIEGKIFLGRGHDATIRVTDISVSRMHAYLQRAKDGYFYLVDNDSKFGTLALIRTPFLLEPKCKIQLQLARTLFLVEMRDLS
jgi:pSer/pThr/pTyr-binding forkhead associated (FHA) protein